MRRAEKEIKDAESLERILQSSKVMHLSMIDGDEPYVVPLYFGYASGSLFFHSAREGRKIDVLKRNPKVCFNVVADEHIYPAPTACGYSARYESVTGVGTAVFLADRGDKRAALDAFMSAYSKDPLPFEDAELDRVVVVRVDIERMTGKRSKGRPQ
jgi:nitroimidazol reductase NimA-like FMN-containing flavoprotein (pyridoxamine 5'-phosphate oxidase superfamily)